MRKSSPLLSLQRADWLSRRCLLTRSAVAAIAAKLSPAGAPLFKSGWGPIRTQLWHDPVGRDTFNGLIVFVVPGPDR